MAKNLLLKIKIATEHQVKHLGSLVSIISTLLIGGSIVFLDYFFNWPKHELAVYQQLVGIINVFVGIVSGILLTSFSVIFVVMQLASSQFSPRILRYFLANDLHIQQFIGLYVFAVAACFLPQIGFVFMQRPLIFSVVFALILCFYCLLRFPAIIAYLSTNMNISTVTDRIKKATVEEINETYQVAWQHGDPLMQERVQRNKAMTSIKFFSKQESGYIEKINYQTLQVKFTQLVDREKLTEHRLILKPMIGEFILTQANELAVLEIPENFDKVRTEKLLFEITEILDAAISLNRYRSYTQDITFGVRKLIDIAIKAISPAVNDPTTCLNCIDQIGEIMFELNLKTMPSSTGKLLTKSRIYINEFNFDEFVDFCFDQIYQWGKHDPIVVKRIIKTIKQLLPSTQNPYHLKVLIKQIEDKELARIYAFSHRDEPQSVYTKEQIGSIEREVRSFEAEAKEQIQKLENEGVLETYNEKDLSTSEREAILYLIEILKNW